MIRTRIIALLLPLLMAAALCAQQPDRPRRHINPVNNAASATQPINEMRNDTARINAVFRANAIGYPRNDGTILWVDSVAGTEWIDSAAINNRKRVLNYPKWGAITLGANIWDPIMRVFGQHYGLIDFSADFSIYNRFFPTVEVGLGTAKHYNDSHGFTYHSPLTIYAKAGCDYNFMFNGNSDYAFTLGLRYGFAPFKWSVDGITGEYPYWQQTQGFDIPSQSATAGWMEICIGLRVKLWRNISAGWKLRYHSILHESRCDYGEPWYIPGFGTRESSITGSFSIYYTLPSFTRPKPQPLPEADSPQ